MGQLFIWSCCELFIGIVCSCLPTLAPLFRQWSSKALAKRGSSVTALPNCSDPSKLDHTFKGRAGGKADVNATSATITDGEYDFHMPKKKREWSRLHTTGSQLRLRDDEIELRTNITGSELGLRDQDCQKEDRVRTISDIRVRSDIRWRETHVDDK